MEGQRVACLKSSCYYLKQKLEQVLIKRINTSVEVGSILDDMNYVYCFTLVQKSHWKNK